MGLSALLEHPFSGNERRTFILGELVMARHWRALARTSASGLAIAAATLLLIGISAPSSGAITPGTGTGTTGATGTTGTTGTPRPACSRTVTGGLVNCPSTPPARTLPAGTRDQRTVSATPADLAAVVDTRTWTSGGGNTFPGADVPFGMVQWSPDTAPSRSDGGGYTYGDRHLIGYSLTHVSGPGCAAAGDVPVLPMTGPLGTANPNDVLTQFSNSREVAQAGYYSARSNSPRTITSRFTAASHAAIGEFTFPRTNSADFLIKLDDSERRDFGSTARVTGPDEISGSETSGDFCEENPRDGPQNYVLHFDIIFSRPFRTARIIRRTGATDPDAVFVAFNTQRQRTVEAKVAISYVSLANARLDRERDLPGWDFGYYQAKAQRTWNRLLGEIKVSGGSYARTQEFYSLLYKDFLTPSITSDVNGQYRGSDLRVHRLAKGQSNQYGMFSGWDIYHSLAQLQAMLDPAAASNMAQSLVNYYGQNRLLPQWGYLYLDNYVMVGDPADAIIADYYAFGARRFQTRTALSDMVRQATTTNRVRPGQAAQVKYGYLPQNLSYGCCGLRDNVSAMLEYDTADFALSRYAWALGYSGLATRFQGDANAWYNVFDPANDLLTSRYTDGQFATDVGAATGAHYTEGDAEEYLWDVPNNYAALFGKLGGSAAVVPELTRYLSQPNARGDYAYLSDEFDLGEQNALDYAGDPAGTQAAVSDLRQNLYRPGPFGFANNDDLGGESSQFIWEMLGLYPENPGSGILVFASPGFPHAVIALPSGHVITISAPGASPHRYYVSSLRINGASYRRLYVPFSSLRRGATLTWTLSPSPTSWGSAPADAPPSY
jgi:predicted alpha-1,2-mannosidase